MSTPDKRTIPTRAALQTAAIAALLIQMSINLTPEEKKLYGSLFKTADKESVGIVTGDDAKVLFQKSSLSPALLGEIWQLSDTENSGFLNQIGFSTALRLIGHAQNGARVSAQLRDTPGPLPKFQGINLIEDQRVASPAMQQRMGSPLAQAQGGNQTGGQGGLPALTPQDKARFSQLFSQSAQNGLVDGGAARDIFLKARLPHETLGQIWNLVDTQNRGSLDQGEFIAAMHLIQSSMNGSMPQVPSQLPQGYIESVRPQAARISSASSFMSTSSNNPGVIRQYTGQQIGQGNDWSITPQERQRYDGIFAALDKKKTGLIGADAVVPFLTTSRLPEAALAQVWDLADVNNRGEFGRAEFAIAMHLVQQNIGGRELPQQLPESLQREVNGNSQPQQQQHSPQNRMQSPPISQPKPAPPKPTINDDLVQLNDLFSSPPPQQKQFVPSSDFGQKIKGVEPAQSPIQHQQQQQQQQQPPTVRSPLQTMSPAPQQLGNPSHTGPPVVPRNIHSDDLLASNNELSNKLSSASTDFANLSNQIGSLTSQTTSIKDQRAKAEAELAAMQAKKKDIETKLTQLRTLYESEVSKVKQVEHDLTVAKAETEKVQQEFSIVDASLHAVQSQYQQVTAAYESDKAKNVELKEKIRLSNEEVSQVKEQLATAEKEAKHQKNLLSINDKQRAMLEEEHAKMQAQIDAHNAEIAATKRELEERAKQPAPAPPAPRAVPAPEHRSSPNNPFFSAAGGAVLGAIGGAAATHATHAASGPPPVSFGGQHQAQPKIDDFEEAFSQMDASPSQAPSSVTADTPISSVQSDFNEYQPENAGFTLPLARPHSSTSSVQNNAPLSVRGENFSRPDSPVSNITRLSDSTAPIPFEGSREHDDVVTVPGSADNEITGAIAGAAGHPGLASKETISADIEQPTPHGVPQSVPDVDGLTSQLKSSEPFPSEPFAQPFGANPAAQPAPFSTPPQFHGEEPHPETNAALEKFTDGAEPGQPDFGKAAEPFPEQPFAQPFGSNPTQFEEDSGNESFEFVSADENEHSVNEMPRDKGKAAIDDDSSDDDEVEQIGINRYKNYQPKDAVADHETSSDVATPQHEAAQPTYSSMVEPEHTAPGTFPEEASNEIAPAQQEQQSSPVNKSVAFPGGPTPSRQGTFASAAEEKAQAAVAAAENKELPPNPPTYDESEGPTASTHRDTNSFNFEAPAGSTLASSGQDDFFDDAFADLEETNVEQNTSLDHSQYNDDFSHAFDDMSSQAPAPAEAPANDEWEQIFAGMASGPPAVTPAAASGPARASTPRSRAVQELTGMGFSEEKAIQALQKHKYNVTEATNFLLDQS